MIVSVFSAEFGLTADTCSASVYVVVFLAGSDAPRAVFPCLSAFRRRQQWQYMVFTGDGALALYSLFSVIRPKICDIMAGLDEKESQTTVAGFAGDHGLYAQKDSYELGSGMSRLVLLVAMHLALCSLR